MCARFTVLSDTPIPSAIAGCVIPISRHSTIWMRSRCAGGNFQCRAVFSRRTLRKVIGCRETQDSAVDRARYLVTDKRGIFATPHVSVTHPPQRHAPLHELLVACGM